MPGYRARIIRNEDQALIWDSISGGSFKNVTIFDKPPPGTWTYSLQIQGTGSMHPYYLTFQNDIGILKLNR